jgi:AcrR family transcriptional regulator
MAYAEAEGKKINRQDRKSRLLDAAILEFSRRGMAGARIDSIARAAGANKQLLYHYFGDKAQLEREVILAVIQRQEEEESLFPQADSIREFVAMRCRRRILRPMARLWGRMLAWEALEHGTKSLIQLEERRARIDVNFLARIRKSQESGEIDAAFDAEMLALAIIAMELIPSTLPNITMMVTGLDGDEPEFADRFIATVSAILSRLEPVKSPEGSGI